jgi:hypothetical protein
MEQADLNDMFKKVSINVCTLLLLYFLVSCLPLQKTKKSNLMTLNPQMNELSKWNTPLISCTDQV